MTCQEVREGAAVALLSRTPLDPVVADHLAHGTSPEEMHLQYPHVSIAQICAALAYYYDHQADLDAQIAQQMREYEDRRSAAPDTPGKAKLRSRGLI